MPALFLWRTGKSIYHPFCSKHFLTIGVYSQNNGYISQHQKKMYSEQISYTHEDSVFLPFYITFVNSNGH